MQMYCSCFHHHRNHHRHFYNWGMFLSRSAKFVNRVEQSIYLWIIVMYNQRLLPVSRIAKFRIPCKRRHAHAPAYFAFTTANFSTHFLINCILTGKLRLPWNSSKITGMHLYFILYIEQMSERVGCSKLDLLLAISKCSHINPKNTPTTLHCTTQFCPISLPPCRWSTPCNSLSLILRSRWLLRSSRRRGGCGRLLLTRSRQLTSQGTLNLGNQRTIGYRLTTLILTNNLRLFIYCGSELLLCPLLTSACLHNGLGQGFVDSGVLRFF
mmetsp:Transcript_24178/g.37283  ORF Transcript_24178/g.37283 Transcript_24178/m.37283 type:complete len:268 (+) Transcript_24178:282-1085(+)